MLNIRKSMSTVLAATVLMSGFAGFALTGCAKEDTNWQENARSALPAALDDTSMGTIYAEGKVLSFPMKVEDLLSNGWSYPTNIKDIDKETLDANYTSGSIDMNIKGKKIVKIKATNIETETLDLKKCYIEEICFTKDSGNIMLPGGIEIGHSFKDENELISTLPSVIARADDEGSKLCYVGYYTSEDNFSCKMTLLFENKNSSLVLTDVKFSSDYLPSVKDLLSAELDAVINKHYDPYSKYSTGDCEAYVADSREYLIESIVALYGYMFDSLSDTQYETLDNYFLSITSDVTWEFEENGDNTISVTFFYPNLEEQLDAAYESSYARYIELYDESDNMWADPVLLDMFIEDLCAQASSTMMLDGGSFTFDLVNNTISDDDFSDLSFSVMGLYDFIVYLKTEEA